MSSIIAVLKKIANNDLGVGEAVDKSKLSCPVGGKVNWCSHCEKQYIWKFLSKTKSRNTI